MMTGLVEPAVVVKEKIDKWFDTRKVLSFDPIIMAPHVGQDFLTNRLRELQCRLDMVTVNTYNPNADFIVTAVLTNLTQRAKLHPGCMFIVIGTRLDADEIVGMKKMIKALLPDSKIEPSDPDDYKVYYKFHVIGGWMQTRRRLL